MACRKNRLLGLLVVNGPLHDEKSYSSPEDSSGYDIGLDSDEERERVKDAAATVYTYCKEREFVRNRCYVKRWNQRKL